MTLGVPEYGVCTSGMVRLVRMLDYQVTPGIPEYGVCTSGMVRLGRMLDYQVTLGVPEYGVCTSGMVRLVRMLDYQVTPGIPEYGVCTSGDGQIRANVGLSRCQTAEVHCLYVRISIVHAHMYVRVCPVAIQI